MQIITFNKRLNRLHSTYRSRSIPLSFPVLVLRPRVKTIQLVIYFSRLNSISPTVPCVFNLLYQKAAGMTVVEMTAQNTDTSVRDNNDS